MSGLKKRSAGLAFALLLLFGPTVAPAADLVPFRTANRSPLVHLHGLPAAGEAILLAPGRSRAHLALDVASSHTDSAGGGEAVLLDGESYYLNLGLRRGVGRRLELTLDLPWISHRRGFLDGFISDWHDTFNLPGGGRDEAPEDRLLYAYSRDGVERVRLDSAAEGIGDLRLGAAWQIAGGSGAQRSLALRGQLKLPTGDEEELLGSGGTDLALWLTGDLQHGRFALFGAAGILWAEDGDVLPEIRRNWVPFGTLGAGWTPRDWIAFKLQVDGHGPFYRSALDELGDASAQLTLGGTLAFTERLALDLGVSEDIVVNTSPDVVFHLALRQLF